MLLRLLLYAFTLNSTAYTHNIQANIIKDTAHHTMTKQFDLAELRFTENINQLLNENGLSLKDGVSEEQTLDGFETYEHNTAALLRYNNVVLNGASGENTNKVVFHYSVKDSLVAMYEVKLYTAAQSSNLIKSLRTQLGKTTFEKRTTDKELLQEQKDFIVWETSSGINYYLIAITSLDKSPQTTYTELTVIDTKKKSTMDWIKFRAFDWYKK